MEIFGFSSELELYGITTISTYVSPFLPPINTTFYIYGAPPLPYGGVPFPVFPPPLLSLTSFQPSPPQPTVHLMPYLEHPEVESEVEAKETVSTARPPKRVSEGSVYGSGGRKNLSKQGWFSKKKISTNLWKPKEEAAVIGKKTPASPVVKIEHPKVITDEPITPNGNKTTVMVKNIPNKYTRKMLLEFLDEHCKEENLKLAGSDKPSTYDFVYLPIDFESECNKGYAFVNFTDPIAAWRMYTAKNNHKWGVLSSKKICEISYARLQGKEALHNQFEHTTFVCEKDEFLPVYFVPYRGDEPGRFFLEFTVGTRIDPSSQ